MKEGDWAPHSKELAGYLEVVDQWEDYALLGVCPPMSSNGWDDCGRQ